MKLKWDESAWEEYTEIQARDKQMLKRINMLVKDAMRSPFEGIGKPEGLKWNLQGYWSGYLRFDVGLGEGSVVVP